MTVATYLAAECEVVGRLKEGQYGPYHPCKFKTADGIEFWKSWEPGAQELKVVRKGEVYSFVQLPGKNGKPDYKLVIEAQPSTHKMREPEQQSTPQSSGKSSEIKDYADRYLKTYRYVWGQTTQIFDGLSEESIRAIATSAMISICKRFELERP